MKFFGANKPTAPAAKKDEAPAPLANFAGIYEALAKAQTANAGKGVMPTLDAKQLGEALAKQQIAPAMSAAQMEAIKNGGEEAVAAVAQIMNQTAQSSVMQSILATQRMAEAANTVAQESVLNQLPQLIRDQQFQQQLFATMPNLNNPAVAPLVEQVRAGIAASNPNLTPEQLTAQAQEFFTGLSSLVAPATASTGGDETPAETDYFAHFGIQLPEAAKE
jgi:hypothetical protein